MKNQRLASIFMFSFGYLVTLESSAIETKGTAQINIGNEENISVLIPLKQSDAYTTFTQGLIRDGIYSLGFGHRTQIDDYLLGLNSFYTMNEENKSRLSIGFEASKEEFIFNANQYFGLDDWAREAGEYTKTAEGFDVSLAFRPKEIPSFLGRVSYSKFDDNPEQFKLGANYQPIPLLSFNLDYDLNDDDVTGYIQLTYRFNETFASQLESENLPKYQSLQAQRLDLARFNTNLYQKKKAFIDETTTIMPPLKVLTLSALQDSAQIGEINTLQVKVFTKKNGEIYLLDDVIVKFKSEDLVLGVATSENGLARLDFTSQEPAVLNVFSLSEQTQSNTITVSFVESIPQEPITPDVVLPTIPTPEVPPVEEVVPEVPEPETPAPEPEVPPVEEVVPEVPEPETPAPEPEVPPVEEVVPEVPEPEAPAPEPEVPPVEEVVPEVPEPETPAPEPEVPPVEEVVPEVPEPETPAPEPEVPPVEEVVPEVPEPETPAPEPEVPPAEEIDPNAPDKCRPTISVRSASQSPSTYSYAYPQIENFYVAGSLGVGEILTVNYTFVPVQSADPFKIGNATRYKIGPVGTTSGSIWFDSPFAGSDPQIGVNSFTLPPLTEEMMRYNLEVSLWALNLYDEGGNKYTLSLNPLSGPCR